MSFKPLWDSITTGPRPTSDVVCTIRSTVNTTCIYLLFPYTEIRYQDTDCMFIPGINGVNSCIYVCLIRSWIPLWCAQEAVYVSWMMMILFFFFRWPVFLYGKQENTSQMRRLCHLSPSPSRLVSISPPSVPFFFIPSISLSFMGDYVAVWSAERRMTVILQI